MKILFVSDVSLYNPSSGSEQVLFQQATGLRRRGLSVFAISRQKKRSRCDVRAVDGVHEGFYQASPRQVWRAFYSLANYPCRLYRRFSHDAPFQAVICHQPFTCFFLLFRRKLVAVPVLYVFHSPSHEEYLIAHANKKSPRIFVQSGLRRLIERYCLKRAQKIMVLSRYMRQKVQAHHRLPAARIVVNPGGVDLERFKPSACRSLLKKKLDFPAGRIHLLSVRNLDPRMGLDNLIKCMAVLKKKNASVHLVIGGEGPERENLNRLIAAEGLNDRVVMRGFIPNELLPDYYSASDFFVLPTRFLEGFGLVTPEAMACGTPVLGTPVGATQEILSGFDRQFLFRDASPEAMADGILVAVEKFLKDERKYDDMRARCRAYAEQNYSWQDHLQRLQSVLEEITLAPSL